MFIHKKELILILLLLVTLMTFSALSPQRKNIKTANLNKANPARNITKPISIAPKKVLLLDDYLKINSQDTIYVQTIQFPLMSEAEQQFVGKIISDYRSAKIKNFIDSFYNRDKVIDQYYQNFSYIQKWTVEIVYQTQTELSLKLANYEFTGGAHGNTSVKNFNFDLTNFKVYKLSDKFKKIDLEKLASYCSSYCQKNNIPIFEDKIKTSPDLLQIWNFTKDGLLLTFPQYTIAPYSSGIIEIHIPNNELINLQKSN